MSALVLGWALGGCLINTKLYEERAAEFDTAEDDDDTRARSGHDAARGDTAGDTATPPGVTPPAAPAR